MAPPPPTTGPRGGNKRKRQQEADTAERLRQYGVDLPQIPGLPLTIIPLHVFALKTTTQSFKKDASQVAVPPYHVPEEDNEEDAADNTDGFNVNNDPSVSMASSSSHVMDRILDRVQHAAAASATTSGTTAPNDAEGTRRAQKERLEKRRDAIATWLRAIHRQVKDDHQRKKRKEQEAEEEQQAGETKQKVTSSSSSRHSVVVSALEHLWGIGLDHDRIDVRRATLHMAGHLLEKSSEARAWLLQQESPSGARRPNISNWLDVLTAKPKNTSMQDESSAAAATRRKRRRLWQREAYWLLQHLDASGASEFYPCLPVALQRLEQEFPWMSSSSSSNSNQQLPAAMTNSNRRSNTTTGNNAHPNDAIEDHDNNSNMVDWRKWRDLAMEHCEEEERRVRKLLARCQVQMDVLVPRIGGDDDEEDKKQPATTTATAGDDSDNDIDWEDGFEDEGSNDDDEEEVLEESEEAAATRHAANVDRTLEVMQTAAGMQGGELEISLQQPGASNDAAEGDPLNRMASARSPEAMLARTRLEKAISILSKRHMRRLSMWVNGLTQADGLVQQPGSGSLVQMSNEKTQHRRKVLDTIVELKSAVASALSLAKRLGIQPQTNNNVTSAQQQQTGTASVAPTITTTRSSRASANISLSLTATPRHQGLTASFMRQRKANRQQHRKPNRVQIKFNRK